MKTRHIQPSSRTDEVTTAILAMDLGPIKYKLMTSEGGGWSLDQVEEVEVWYKRFLMLTHLHRGTPIVPAKLIDQMWHTHILDTAKYADDCSRVFGGFVHHFPYFGVRSEQDRSDLNCAWESTKQMLRDEFSEDPAFDDGMSLCAGGSDCGRGCAVCAPNSQLTALTKVRPSLGDPIH